MSKKNIKFVTTIGDKLRIFKDIEEKIKNIRLPENKKETLKAFKLLKKSLKNDSQEKTDMMKKYLTKKNGKYIVFCKDNAQIQEFLKNADKLFGKVNKDIEITTILGDLTKKERRNLIEKFNKQEDDDKLKLLLINRKTQKKYDFSEVDGVIYLYSTNDVINRRNNKFNEGIELCKDNGVIIHFVDSLYVVEKYAGTRSQILENEKVNVEFIDEKSFKEIDSVRKKTFNMGMSYNAKFEIMKEYIKKTGKEITFSTVYKGHKIGVWQNNLRQGYMHNTLELDDKLLKEFVDVGIIGERKRAKGLSDNEKFEILKTYRENNPEKIITIDTVDNNIPVGQHRWALQRNIHIKKTDLTEEQIEYLRKNRLLNCSKKEIKELSKKYNISEKTANVITMRYETIDEFAKLYKQRKANIKTLKLNKRGIIASKNAMSQEQKQKYLQIIEDAFGENILEDGSKFVTEEDIISALGKLRKNERKILFSKYGIGTEKKTEKQLLEEMECHRAYIYKLQNRALNKFQKALYVYPIDSLNRLKTRFTNEIEKISNMTEKQWQNYHMNLDIEQLSFTETMTRNLKQSGYDTLEDLAKAKKDDLAKVPSIGSKKVDIILNKINESKSLKKAEKIKKLKNILKNIDGKITAYNMAYNYYMETENIFNDDEIIPPSIVEQSSLSKKKEEKSRKQAKLEQLDNQINEQDEKTEKLEKIIKPEEVK